MAWFIEDDSTWDLEMERNRLIEEEGKDEFTFSRRFALDNPSINSCSNDFSLHAASISTPSGGLTYSASCPSFTSMYEISSEELIQDICNDSIGNTIPNIPVLSPNSTTTNSTINGGSVNNHIATTRITNSTTTQPNGPAFTHIVNQNAPLMFNRTQHVNHFGFSPTGGSTNMTSMMSGMHHARRGMLQSSASFTSLSAIEADHKRRQAKRKKDLERWSKKTRQKSFDSSLTISPSVDFASNFPSTTSSSPEEDAAFMTNDSNKVGHSIDDFRTTFITDDQWPNVSTISTTTTSSTATSTTTTTQPSLYSSSAQSLSIQTSATMSNTSMEDEFLFGGDQVSSTLLDEFDTEVMGLTTATTTSPAVTTTTTSISNNSQEVNSNSATAAAITSTTTLPSLTTIVKNALERKRFPGKKLPCLLIDTIIAERLFGNEKCKETAGSLWLMFHAFKCCHPLHCEITNCDVMKRVVKHCMACSKPIGACLDVCNDAKTMLLHYTSCEIPLNCMVCTQLKEIDQAHEAIVAKNGNKKTLVTAAAEASSSGSSRTISTAFSSNSSSSINSSGSSQTIQPKLVTRPLAASGSTSSTSTSTSTSTSCASSSSKPVPIQPSPIPPIASTSTIPLLMTNYPQFSALALYLEQTSPVFRAEVNERVEKHVKKVAGQDLIQHMQKRTRLRSLNEIRIEARAMVLREMEQEIQLHLTTTFGRWPGSAPGAPEAPVATSEENGTSNPTSTLPAYLFNAAAATAGLVAFFSQQSEFANAAMKIVPRNDVTNQSRKSPTRSSSSSSSSSSTITTSTSTRKKNEDILMAL